MGKGTAPSVAKLERIQQLWLELGRAALYSPEYEKLIEEIRVASREYVALVSPPKKPEKSD
jgi:hypothetical protein